MALCLYNSTIHDFLQMSPETLLGHFVNNYHGTILTATNEAWAADMRCENGRWQYYNFNGQTAWCKTTKLLIASRKTQRDCRSFMTAPTNISSR